MMARAAREELWEELPLEPMTEMEETRSELPLETKMTEREETRSELPLETEMEIPSAAEAGEGARCR